MNAIIKMTAALVALYCAIQIVNPTGFANANSEQLKYSVEFNKAEKICVEMTGGKVDQIMKYGYEICKETASKIAKEKTK